MDASNEPSPTGRALLRQQLSLDNPDKELVRDICRKDLCGTIPADLRADVWTILLDVKHKDRFLLDDRIRTTQHDLDNQRVIRVDTKRTRADLPVFQTDQVQALVARILTFFCKKKELRYKQGLNEVLAPFVVLRGDTPLPDGVIFNLFESFVDRFLPHMYADEEFVALQCVLQLFRLVLQYHDPELCHRLDQHNMVPELYATPWFLTLFARNVSLDLLYEVWDSYLLNDRGDGRTMHVFYCLGFVLSNRDMILQIAPTDLPMFLTSVLGQNSTGKAENNVWSHSDLVCSMTSSAKVREIFQLGLKLKQCTPQAITSEIYSVLYNANEGDGQIRKYESMKCCFSSVKDIQSGALEPLISLDCRPKDQFELAHMKRSYHLDPELLAMPEELDAALKRLAKNDDHHYVLFGTSEEDQDVTTLFTLHLLQRTFKHVSYLQGNWNVLRNSIKTVCGPPTVVLYNIVKRKEEAASTKDTWMGKVKLGVEQTKTSMAGLNQRMQWLTTQSKSITRDLTSTKLTQWFTKDNTNATPNAKTAQHDNSWIELNTLAAAINENKLSLFDAKKVDTSHSVIQYNDLSKGLLMLSVGDGYITELRKNPVQVGLVQVVTKYDIKDLLKITSKRSLKDLVVFHFKSQHDDKPLKLAFVITNSKLCIETVSKYYHQVCKSV